MHVSEDGTVTGSVDVSKLDEIEPKTDEARAQLNALRADAGLEPLPEKKTKSASEKSDEKSDEKAAAHKAPSGKG